MYLLLPDRPPENFSEKLRAPVQIPAADASHGAVANGTPGTPCSQRDTGVNPPYQSGPEGTFMVTSVEHPKCAPQRFKTKKCKKNTEKQRGLDIEVENKHILNASQQAFLGG
jgi:hypothetical protein